MTVKANGSTDRISGVSSPVLASAITLLATLATVISPWSVVRGVLEVVYRFIARLARSACFSTLRKMKVGHVRVVCTTQASKSASENGEKTESEVFTFGEDPATASHRVQMTVTNDWFWIRLALFSALGFGEAFMYGEVAVDDLTLLMKLFILNREHFGEMKLLGPLNTILNNVFHSHIPNTIMNALRNIQAHYDLGNEMFAGFLDPTMTYSCPIWEVEGNNAGVVGDRKEEGSGFANGGVRRRRIPGTVAGWKGKENEERMDEKIDKEKEEDTLERAQLRKIHAMLDKACIRPGDHVLEIGTGWGALAIEAVRRHDCRVTTLTLSSQQKALAEARIASLGLSSKITVLLCDYRKLDPTVYQFDRIITVEMLEAVGPEFLPVFFSTCNKLLKTQGVLVLQVITMPDSRYHGYRRKVDFIQKHIFPGGHCPSVTALVEAVYKGSEGNLIVDDLQNIGPHYAKALRLWREVFVQKFDGIVEDERRKWRAEHSEDPEAKGSPYPPHVYDDVFKRKWEFYFAYCEAGFATRTLGDVQVRCVRMGNAALLEGIPM
ncbi:hypothetical protein HK102_001219 [Quaeritorhiza haematococci]|nr:hypothetical protein HK102_001219 [Quaeritorhiza haematococci]